MVLTIEDDLANALVIIRDTNLGYPPGELHLTGYALREFYTRAVARIEPDAKCRAEDWMCDYLDEDARL
jgi:hypothetical protein